MCLNVLTTFLLLLGLGVAPPPAPPLAHLCLKALRDSWTNHRSGQKAWNSCLWDDPQKVKPSHNMALHSLFVNLFLTSKISLVLSLKQYRPYVLNLAFGLEVISACRRGSPTDKIFQQPKTIILTFRQNQQQIFCEWQQFLWCGVETTA